MASVPSEINDIIAYAKYTDGDLSSSDVMKLVAEIERLRFWDEDPVVVDRSALLKRAVA
jgi:hypothetical protein